MDGHLRGAAVFVWEIAKSRKLLTGDLEIGGKLDCGRMGVWDNGNLGEPESGRYEWEGKRVGAWECGNTCMFVELSTLLVIPKYNT